MERALSERTFFVMPIALYSSDTGFGGGGAGYKNFRTDLPRSSSLQFATIFTTRKQLVTSMRLEVFFRGGRDRLYLNVSYRKFPTDFYGMGNDTANDDPERYTPERTAVECFYEWNLWRNLKLRPSLIINNQAHVKTEEGRLIDAGTLPGARGRFDGGAGVGVVWDSRDNTQAATRGLFAALEHQGMFLQDEGAPFNMTRLDVRSFWSPAEELVFGSMLLVRDARGDVPFYFQPLLGGEDHLRGYEEGRFIDRSLVLVQQDIRFPVWRIVGGAVFIGTGRVAPRLGDALSGQFHTTAGVGLRVFLNREERMLVRADMAWSDDSDGFYVTFGEAF